MKNPMIEVALEKVRISDDGKDYIVPKTNLHKMLITLMDKVNHEVSNQYQTKMIHVFFIGAFIGYFITKLF